MMLLSTAFFSLNDATMKLALAELPYGHAFAVRGIVSCALLLVVVRLKFGMGQFVIKNWKGQIICAIYFFLASFLYIYSLPFLSLPVAVTAVYTAPLFIALLAPWLLRERSNYLIISATLIGFLGVALAAGYESTAFSWLILLPIASALATAMRDIELRTLTKTDSVLSILLLQQAMLALFGLVYACFEPHPSVLAHMPSYGLAALASVGATLGVFFVMEAIRIGNVTAISPLRFTAILWAALFGWVLWGDHFSSSQLFGMLLVAISGTAVTLSGRRAV